MGKKGKTTIDIPSLLEAITRCRVMRAKVEEDIAAIKTISNDLVDSGKMQGGAISENIQEGCNQINLGMNKVAALLNQVSKCMDDVSVAADEEIKNASNGKESLESLMAARQSLKATS